MALSLGGLWRYPVKSMAGEAVHRAELTEVGVPGNRLVGVRGPEAAALAIGEARIDLDSLRGRCPMTTVDPDTITRDPAVLKDIGRRFGGKLALNANVSRGGAIAVGDDVLLLR